MSKQGAMAGMVPWVQPAEFKVLNMPEVSREVRNGTNRLENFLSRAGFFSLGLGNWSNLAILQCGTLC
jgi:hypothetical protein